MNLLEYIRLLKLVMLVVLVTLAVANPVVAATDHNDSILTVSQFGRRVFHNLNMFDTLNGAAKYDSNSCQQDVRDAVVEVGDLLPQEKASTIVTVSGTFGYEVDSHLDSLQAVVSVRNKKGILIDVVPWRKLMEAISLKGEDWSMEDIEYATLHGDSVYFYPYPARVDTMYLFYTARGTVPTASSSTVDLPHELYMAVEYLTTVKGAADIGNAQRLQVYTKLYDREIVKFIGGRKPQ